MSAIVSSIVTTPTARPIARLSNPTPETFFREYVATATPVVLTDTHLGGTIASKRNADDSAAWTARWTAESVAKALGERTFHFKRSANNAHPNFRAANLGEMFAREAMTFETFFSRISSGTASERAHYIFTGDEHYVARQRDGVWSVNPELQPLWEATQVPPFVPEDLIYSVWAWFSGQGVFTWLHYDNNGCHNLNVQLHGQKRCVLLHPDSLAELELYEPGGAVPAFNCSRLDLESTEGARKLASVPHVEATLHAGDLLYIPPHWLHAFWHQGTYNANVNFWWKPSPSEYPGVDDNAVARREARLQTHQAHQR